MSYNIIIIIIIIITVLYLFQLLSHAVNAWNLGLIASSRLHKKYTKCHRKKTNLIIYLKHKLVNYLTVR